MIFEWRDETIHYADEGSGPAMVLLHGLGGNAENWLLQRRHFPATHRVLSLDLPGHGRSTGRAVPFADYPHVIAAMLDHAGVAQATLCGLSKGARAGIGFAVQHPDRVTGVVIVNAFLHLEADDRARRLALYDLLLEDDGLDRWANQLLTLMGVEDHLAIVRGFRRSLGSLDPVHIRNIFRQQIDWDQRPDLRRMSCPALVVQGTKDGFIPGYCSDEMLDGLSDGRRVVLDAGHLPYLEDPRAFNACVADFLARLLLPTSAPEPSQHAEKMR